MTLSNNLPRWVSEAQFKIMNNKCNHQNAVRQKKRAAGIRDLAETGGLGWQEGSASPRSHEAGFVLRGAGLRLGTWDGEQSPTLKSTDPRDQRTFASCAYRVPDGKLLLLQVFIHTCVIPTDIYILPLTALPFAAACWDQTGSLRGKVSSLTAQTSQVSSPS